MQNASPSAVERIRGLMWRATTPELDLEFSFQPARKGFTLNVLVTNSTDAPSPYTSVTLMLDRRLKVSRDVRNYSATNHTLYGAKENWAVRTYSMQFRTPQYKPIFADAPAVFMSEHAIIRANQRYALAYRLSCPGFARQRLGLIIRESGDPRFEALTDTFEHRRPNSFLANLLRGQALVSPAAENVPSDG